MPGDVTQVIVLNGGSSAGKSTLARMLQERLPGLWLTFGTDVFIEALPGRGASPRADITTGDDGAVTTGPSFRSHELAWYRGLAAMARAGAPLVLDEVVLAGGDGQRRLAAVFEGLDVLWVGVRCDVQVAAAREAQRPDRVAGMARRQADAVHVGMRYDVEVDTSVAPTERCAEVIVRHVRT